MEWVRLCRFRHGSVFSDDSWVASRYDSAHRYSAGCSGCALWERKRKNRNFDQLIHHSDKGSQYVSIAYTERLREAGIKASVGSTRDSYDNAAAEALNKLYKKEVVWRGGPWAGRDAVEFATLEWVHWYNYTRPHSYCKNLAPAQFEDHYYTETSQPEVVDIPL